MGRPPKERLTPKRCPTCGALVYGKCLACIAKNAPRTTCRTNAAARGITLGIDLRGAARKRYEALRKLKEKEQENEMQSNSALGGLGRSGR